MAPILGVHCTVSAGGAFERLHSRTLRNPIKALPPPRPVAPWSRGPEVPAEQLHR